MLVCPHCQKKKEIANAEKPVWVTNMSFGFTEDVNSRINLQTVTSTKVLVSALASLTRAKDSFEAAAKALGTDIKFTWLGYSYEDWKSDIQTRLNKIELTKKKVELENLEERLNKLVSPEVREALELAEIQAALSKK